MQTPTPSIATKPLLVVTKTCPACRVTTQWLEKKGVLYQKVYAEETPHITQKYGIKSVPVLVVQKPQGQDQVLMGFYEIRDYFS